MYLVYFQTGEVEAWYREPNFTDEKGVFLWSEHIKEGCGFDTEDLPSKIIEHLCRTARDPANFHIVWIDSRRRNRK